MLILRLHFVAFIFVRQDAM